MKKNPDLHDILDLYYRGEIKQTAQQLAVLRCYQACVREESRHTETQRKKHMKALTELYNQITSTK